MVENLEDVIVKYRQTKSKIKNVTPENIDESKGKLLQLKYSGNHFKELLDKEIEFQDNTIDVRMGGWYYQPAQKI